MVKYKIYNFVDKVINFSSENQDKIISNKFIVSSNKLNRSELEYSFDHFVSDKFLLKDFKKLVKDIENYEKSKKEEEKI